jgi:hypothetical protein
LVLFETINKKGSQGGNNMAKQNNLTLTKVKKQYKKTQEKVNYELKDGNNLTLSPLFAHSEIEKLLLHMSEQFKYAEVKGIEINEKFTYDYVLFLCIKQFTHLGKEISEKFEEQILQMEWLVDTGYFKEIVEDVFMQDQIQVVFDKAVEISSKFIFLEKLTEQMQSSVKNLELKNRDVIEQLGNKVVK